MAVIQPLYYSGGSYKASDDRNFLASFGSFLSDGRKRVGVIGNSDISTTSRYLYVAAGATAGTITIQPGLCLIPDSGNHNSTNANNKEAVADNPGLYLTGIDTTAYTMALTLPASSTSTDLIYAQIDATPVTISSASRSSTTVTITTSTNHGFLVGDTVVISYLDEVFNGSFTIVSIPTTTTFTYTTSTSGTISSTTYNATAQRIDSQGTTLGSAIVITNRTFAQSGTTAKGTATITTTSAHSLAVGDTVRISGLSSVLDGDFVVATVPSSTTFTYTRSWTGTAITSSLISGGYSHAYARATVPVRFRQLIGSTTLDDTGYQAIPLAQVTLSTSAVTSVVDRRLFTGTNGGVLYYDKLAGTSTNANRPSVANKGQLIFEINDNKLYLSDGTNWNEVLNSTHNHDTIYYPAPLASSGVLAKPVSKAANSLITISGTTVQDITINPSGTMSVSFTCTSNSYVLVEFSARLSVTNASALGQIDVAASGATTVAALTVVSGIGTNTLGAIDGTSMGSSDWIYHSYNVYGTAEISHKSVKLFKVSSGTTTFTLKGKTSGSSHELFISAASLRVIPLYKY